MPTGNNNCRKSICVMTSQFETSAKITFAQSTHRTFQKQNSLEQAAFWPKVKVPTDLA